MVDDRSNLMLCWKPLVSTVVMAMAVTSLLTVARPASASADTTVSLPGGQRTENGYMIQRSGERAVISPALNANGTGRTAWVSGKVSATSPNGVPAELEVGYLVGCQVDISGLEGSLGGELTLDSSALSAGLSIPLKAGEVKYSRVTDIDLVDGRASIRYASQGLEITGCGGYAQARSVTKVETDEGAHRYVGWLYGRPFSLG
ncbi:MULTISPECIES: MspA family porin [unclassified Gordonia (in: high G+C Gram-positive bacteria)]|uniref:MspA family porin n=1 Tax=unclassified Gordonia (in: high G+C Gram-positive bacteria) TaxID=2657482 RepID=UPI001586258C|nr:MULTISPECIES: MspA family porin [unclassified Gordonia (in: high G+C Gram-positive bacteria)]MBR7192578.1 MspA family porin [Gordonia sp. SCSIO 19800]